MSQPIANKRSKQFQINEIWKLLELLEENSILISKRTDVATNASKERAWNRLSTSFNATNSHPRDVTQLKLKWDNLKKGARKRASLIKANNRATGGGPSSVGEDPILDKVISMTRISCFGLPNTVDSNCEEPFTSAASQERFVEIELLDETQNLTSLPSTTQDLTALPATTQDLMTALPSTSNDEVGSKWKSWSPASLKTPVSSKLSTKKKKLTDELIKSKIARNAAITKYFEYKLELLKKNHEK